MWRSHLLLSVSLWWTDITCEHLTTSLVTDIEASTETATGTGSSLAKLCADMKGGWLPLKVCSAHISECNPCCHGCKEIRRCRLDRMWLAVGLVCLTARMSACYRRKAYFLSLFFFSLLCMLFSLLSVMYFIATVWSNVLVPFVPQICSSTYYLNDSIWQLPH